MLSKSSVSESYAQLGPNEKAELKATCRDADRHCVGFGPTTRDALTELKRKATSAKTQDAVSKLAVRSEGESLEQSKAKFAIQAVQRSIDTAGNNTLVQVVRGAKLDCRIAAIQASKLAQTERKEFIQWRRGPGVEPVKRVADTINLQVYRADVVAMPSTEFMTATAHVPQKDVFSDLLCVP